jgi:phage terminase large subunit-like protein
MGQQARQDEWVRSKRDELAADDGCWFDYDAANRVREFFSRFLRHSKGEWAGHPFELLDWQWHEFVGPLYGWKRADGTRRYDKVYCEIAKKNGKSALLSGLALYHLIADGESGAEVYIAAADRNQASIIYNESANMVQAAPALSDHVMVGRASKRLAYPRSNSFLQVLSADAHRQEGINSSATFFDELHAQKKRDLWDALEYAGEARRQPLLVAITTAGVDRESICYQQRDYARQLLDGSLVDHSFLPIIYAADPEDDWTSEEAWEKANPSLGITIPKDRLAHACETAQAQPSKENAFKRYRLNLWTDSVTRWISSEAWDACDDPMPDLAGEQCFCGLDLSSKIDLTAFVKVFRVGGKWAIVPRIWMPEDRVSEKEDSDRVPYSMWIRQGFIETTPGSVVDYDFIEHAILDDASKYEIYSIGLDPWNAQATATRLSNAGLDVLEFRQGYKSMSGPAKDFEAAVIDGSIIHGGNPVLRWMIANTVIKSDPADNIKPEKEHRNRRIDAVIAAIMGLGLGVAYESDIGADPYRERGFLTL